MEIFLTSESAGSGRPFSANHAFTDRVVSEKWPVRALLTGSGTYTGMQYPKLQYKFNVASRITTSSVLTE